MGPQRAQQTPATSGDGGRDDEKDRSPCEFVGRGRSRAGRARWNELQSFVRLTVGARSALGLVVAIGAQSWVHEISGSRHPGSNRGPAAYKAAALPLSYAGDKP